MSVVSCIGVDPGVTTGFCLLEYLPQPDEAYSSKPDNVILLQADADSAKWVLEGLLGAYYLDERIIKKTASVEAFRNGNSAGTTGKAADTTRQLVMILAETLQLYGYQVKVRTAADVKTWANDKRIKAAGMQASSIHGKSRDSYDGYRQALYSARWDAFMKDPLEKL